jgi:putative ABC transport system permease protein
VLLLVIRQGLGLTFLGLAPGLALSLGLVRVFSHFMYGVSPVDSWLLAALGLTLVLVALAASWLPARRAALVEPMLALRHSALGTDHAK